MRYRFYEHSDRLHGDVDFEHPIGMLEFWRWAFSDLLEDTLKGHYCEWMVGNLLGLPMEHGGRPGYGNYDLRSPNGNLIEVKSSAYWQSWKLRNQDGSMKTSLEIDTHRPTTKKPITFGNLRGRDAVNRQNQDVGYKSDMYVFCFQREIDPTRWDAMDLSQWEFYILMRADLERLNVKSLGLNRLRSLCAPMTAREFQAKGRLILSELSGP